MFQRLSVFLAFAPRHRLSVLAPLRLRFETSLLNHIPHPLVRQRLEFRYFGKCLLFVYSHILFSGTAPLCNLLYLGRKALKDLDKLVGR